MKLAAIDIGTHSVLLLIVENNKNNLIVSLEDQATLTRIGEGMARTNVFLSSGMERTLSVLKKYKTICDGQRVNKIIAVGTAAFRKAQNAKEFVARVKQECGIEIEIISGEREAALTWKAASTDFGNEIMVVDIGGGSTEMMTSATNGISIPVGSVLLTEKFVCSDPISEADYQNICKEIERNIDSSNLELRTSNIEHRTLIATAGTATTLGAIKKKMKIYKHAEIHGSQLTLAELQTIIADFKSKTVEERKKIPGLEPGRADVILAGALLLEKIARHFGFSAITVSDRGVRWGLVYEIFNPRSSPASSLRK